MGVTCGVRGGAVRTPGAGPAGRCSAPEPRCGRARFAAGLGHDTGSIRIPAALNGSVDCAPASAVIRPTASRHCPPPGHGGPIAGRWPTGGAGQCVGRRADRLVRGRPASVLRLGVRPRSPPGRCDRETLAAFDPRWPAARRRCHRGRRGQLGLDGSAAGSVCRPRVRSAPRSTATSRPICPPLTLEGRSPRPRPRRFRRFLPDPRSAGLAGRGAQADYRAAITLGGFGCSARPRASSAAPRRRACVPEHTRQAPPVGVGAGGRRWMGGVRVFTRHPRRAA